MNKIIHIDNPDLINYLSTLPEIEADNDEGLTLCYFETEDNQIIELVYFNWGIYRKMWWTAESLSYWPDKKTANVTLEKLQKMLNQNIDEDDIIDFTGTFAVHKGMKDVHKKLECVIEGDLVLCTVTHIDKK